MDHSTTMPSKKEDPMDLPTKQCLVLDTVTKLARKHRLTPEDALALFNDEQVLAFLRSHFATQKARQALRRNAKPSRPSALAAPKRAS